MSPSQRIRSLIHELYSVVTVVPLGIIFVFSLQNSPKGVLIISFILGLRRLHQ